MQYDHVVRKYCFVIFTALQFLYVIYPLQTSKGKVANIYKELIRRIMTFKYEKLLLLRTLQNKVASNIVITKQNKAS